LFWNAWIDFFSCFLICFWIFENFSEFVCKHSNF
jgi:hypothetical protein